MIKHPSLELNWLPKAKDVPLPNMFVVDDYDYSGCYYNPEYAEVELDGKCVSIENGLIIIKSNTSPSTIAHEFRHHLQWWYGMDLGAVAWDFHKPYKDAIVEYYTKSLTELDALLYECKHYPDDDNMQNYEWVCRGLQL